MVLKLLIFLFTAGLAFTVTNGETENCPAGTRSVAGICQKYGCLADWVLNARTAKCYKRITERLSQEAAVSACKMLGSRLPEVHSPEQNAALHELALVDGKGTWLDAERTGLGGRDFVWSSRAKMEYANFVGNGTDTTEAKDCLQMNAASGQWAAIPCWTQTDVLCETDSYTCEVGWTLGKLTNKCYQHLDLAMDYYEAVAACKAVGAELPTPDSIDENRAIFTMPTPVMRTPGYTRPLIRLGGKRIGPNKYDFGWVSGRPMNFTNYKPIAMNGVEACLEVSKDENGIWNDVPCKLKNFIVCQKDAIMPKTQV